MDEIDRQLLGLLRVNARTPVATLAKKLQIARGTVQNRMSKLEREGVIAGYSVRLKPEVDERRIAALMTIAVEGNNADKVLVDDPAIRARRLLLCAQTLLFLETGLHLLGLRTLTRM